MVKPKRIRKMIGSFFRRIPTLGGRIFSSKAPAPAPEPIAFPCKRTITNALSTAIVGGLNKQSYRELIREGQEMQLKTTMNLMSLMDSLQSQLVVNEEPPQEADPNLFKDCLKLLSSVSQACTTVKGNVIPMDRTTCYQALDLRPLFERIVTYPNLVEQSGARGNDGLTWTSRHNTVRGLLIYTGKRIVRGAPGKSIEYHYNFVFEKPYPLPHDRMLNGLTSIVNVFREEFDAGPWERANRAQIQELEQYMVHSDDIPQEPVPTAGSA